MSDTEPATEREHLSAYITLVTTALRGRRPHTYREQEIRRRYVQDPTAHQYYFEYWDYGKCQR